MRTELLDYSLPEHAIAQRPSAERSGARLLVVQKGGFEHKIFRDWADLVPSGALVVLNDTRVRRARLRCTKSTGGAVELLFLERAAQSGGGAEEWLVLAHANRPLAPGARLGLGEARFVVLGREPGGALRVSVEGHGDCEGLLAQHGLLPLPPYIKRPADAEDAERYQTIFAGEAGSSAAPTAGLHLSRALLDELVRKGVELGHVTLHIGLGTFSPVRCDDLDDHPMHSEPYAVSRRLAEQVAAARRRGAPVFAVGTTVVRALESAADTEAPGHVRAASESTRLLIQPGYRFRVVDGLLTNFHAPKSTLLALVSAFAGHRRLMEAYRVALASGYRFLSYGDAMWLPERMPCDLAEAQTGAAP